MTGMGPNIQSEHLPSLCHHERMTIGLLCEKRLDLGESP